jgi:hypothetical protein
MEAVMWPSLLNGPKEVNRVCSLAVGAAGAIVGAIVGMTEGSGVGTSVAAALCSVTLEAAIQPLL